jgi:hypothetical protein
MNIVLLLLALLAAAQFLPSLAATGLPVPINARLVLILLLLAVVWPRFAGGLVRALAALTFLYLLYRSQGAGPLMQLGVLALMVIGLYLMVRRDITLGVGQTMLWMALGLLAVLVYFLAGLATR